MIRLGAYFDPEGSTGLGGVVPCDAIAELDPAAGGGARGGGVLHVIRLIKAAIGQARAQRAPGAARALRDLPADRRRAGLPRLHADEEVDPAAGLERAVPVEVEFTDAKGLDRVDEPGAAVAGARRRPGHRDPLRGRPRGRDADAGARDARQGVRRRDRRAAPGERDPEPDRQHRPGRPRARGRCPTASRSRPGGRPAFVAIDELTGVFDADTRAYVADPDRRARARPARARRRPARRRSSELAEVTDDATPISRALADAPRAADAARRRPRRP